MLARVVADILPDALVPAAAQPYHRRQPPEVRGRLQRADLQRVLLDPEGQAGDRRIRAHEPVSASGYWMISVCREPGPTR